MADDKDTLIPFILGHGQIRGRLVRLEDVSTSVIHQHNYPDVIAKILAELLASTAALAELLKYEGIFTLQTKSDGPVHLAVVDITSEGNIRGYSSFDPSKLAALEKQDFIDVLGKGYLAFTVDQGLTVDRYQGIVKLESENLKDCLQHYFDQSEQLKTVFYIASEKLEDGTWKSGCLILQQMPAEHINEDDWIFIEAVLNTISTAEFLNFNISSEKLLQNLFQELEITFYEKKVFQAKCRCSEERIKNFLLSLENEQFEELLDNGKLQMTCEFCNHTYEFERKDFVTLH